MFAQTCPLDGAAFLASLLAQLVGVVGVVQEFFNYTRLCGAYADPTCLQQSTEDVCIAQLNAAAATVGQQQQHAVHPVAIALPVVLGELHIRIVPRE